MGREAGGGSGWGTHGNPWLIHVNVWQKTLQYCKVISLQLIKINEKKSICQYRRRNRVPSLDQEDPLEKEIVTHSSILVWEIPLTEEPDGLQFMRLQRVRHD